MAEQGDYFAEGTADEAIANSLKCAAATALSPKAALILRCSPSPSLARMRTGRATSS